MKGAGENIQNRIDREEIFQIIFIYNTKNWNK